MTGLDAVIDIEEENLQEPDQDQEESGVEVLVTQGLMTWQPDDVKKCENK